MTIQGVEPGGALPETRKTIYDLEKIVERCFEEAIKAEYIAKSTGNSAEFKLSVTDYIIKNRQDLIRHISHTIVGELYELEIIRKLQPFARALPQILEDFRFLDSSMNAESRKMSLRMKDHMEPK